MTPTIASLMKIAAALGKSVAYFIEESDDAAAGHRRPRATSAPSVYTSKQGLDLRTSPAATGRSSIAGAEAVVEPQADSGPTPMSHPGEELVICSRARCASRSTASRYELDEGDSIHFRTALPALVAQPVRRAGAGDLAAIRSA